MHTLFYILIALIACFEIYWTFYPDSLIKYTSTELKDVPEEDRLIHALNFLGLFAFTIIYWTVCVLGMIKTPYKILFGCIMLQSLLAFILAKIIDFDTHPKTEKILKIIDSGVSAVILITIFIKEIFI